MLLDKRVPRDRLAKVFDACDPIIFPKEYSKEGKRLKGKHVCVILVDVSKKT